MKTTKQEIGTRYIPSLLELSKENYITGKIAYNCAKSLKSLDEALKDLEKARITLLESRCEKDSDGNPKIIPVTKQDGFEADGTTPKMVVVKGNDGRDTMKYSYSSQQEENEAIEKVLELENTPIDVNIFAIPASEIMSLKDMKNGAMIVFNLGEIIDDSK